jgi:hypothetical protein
MPQTIEIAGVDYEFPDDMSDTDILGALRSNGLIEAPAPPKLGRAPMVSPQFEPAQDVEARAAAQAAEVAGKQMEARTPFIPAGDFKEAQQRAFARETRDIAESRGRTIQAGTAAPSDVRDENVLPIFRPTRVREAEVFQRVPEDQRALMTAEQIVEAETRFPTPLRAPEPIGTERVIQTASGFAPTTPKQEVVESFARQQVMTEEAARQRGAEIAAQQQELDRRAAAGEPVGTFESAGPIISGTLSSPTGGGAGVTETSLGAGLRAGLGWVSALAADGYFRGLGYEVDEDGLPKDPDDFGFAVAEARRAAGLPDVIEPLRYPTAVGRRILNAAGVSEETTERMVKALPQLTFPAPGVATTSTTRKATTFDPEGKRIVSDIEVPSPFEDFEGFVAAETKRIARNVSSGRTIGDEFMDTPAVAGWYEQVWGNPDAAFFAGMGPEMALPAGPGTALRGVKGVANVARKTKAAQKVAGKVLDAAARADLRSPTAAKAVGALADITAVVVPGRASDGHVVRAVAKRVVDSIGLTPEVAAKAKGAIRPTSMTSRDVAFDIADELWRPGMGASSAADEAWRVKRLIDMQVPDDMVMVTESVAVPRAIAPEVTKAVNESVRFNFVKHPRHQMRDLWRMAGELGESGNSRMADAVNKIADRVALESMSETGKVSAKTRSSVTRVVEQAQKALGKSKEEAREIARAFDQQSPAMLASARIPGVDGDALRAAKSWADLPLSTRQAAVDYVKSRTAMRVAGPVARKTRDLTEAQVFLNRGALRHLDSAEFRKVQALRKGSRAETIAVIRAQQAISGASKGVLRKLGKDLNARADKLGNVDDAVDDLFIESLHNLPVKEQWRKVIAALYGDDRADAVLAQAVERELIVLAIDSNSADAWIFSPTVQGLMAIDNALVTGKVVPGIAAGKGPLKWFAPDFHQGMLKVIVEEGARKELAKAGKDYDALINAVERGSLGGSLRRRVESAEASVSTKGQSKVYEVPDSPVNGPAIRVYDTAASHAERALAENGEEFAQLIENISPRMRAGAWRMASDAFNYLTSGVARNIARNAKYGYVLPNLPYLSYRLAALPVVSLVTNGLEATKSTLAQLARRHTLGGGITDVSGVYYSPDMIGKLAERYGIGYSAVEAERVGSLADDLMRDARKVARESGKPKYIKAASAALNEVNPLAKSFGTRMAESIEMSFRQAAFEAALIEGKDPSTAADIARKSAFDYDEVPDLVKETAAKYIATAATQFSIHSEFTALVAKHPANVTRAMKAMMIKQRVFDPYNVHGDKGLKALGIVDIGEGDDSTSFYGPASPLFAPIETLLGAARNTNIVIADIRDISETNVVGAVDEFLSVVFENGVQVTRSLADSQVPAVLEAIDRAGRSDVQGGQSPLGSVLSPDDVAFWQLAAAAHFMDRGRDEGTWDLFERVFTPEVVPPPKALEHPDIPGAWTVQPPEGVPYLFWGRDADGDPIFRTFAPSDQGARNLRAIRALTPEAIERALGATSAMLIDSPSAENTDDRAVVAGPATGQGVAAAAAQALLEPGGPSSPAVRRATQAEALRAVREQF